MNHYDMIEAQDRALQKALTPEPEVTVKYEQPPNYKDIIKVFSVVKRTPGVIFTYGKVIYNPDRVKLTKALYEHECVHSRRQIDPVAWWDQYLRDKEFRFREELAAHQVEYINECDGAGRQVRRRALSLIAARLSGPLYGKMVSKDEAKRLIQGELNEV
jgi:hypothetical protein